MTSRLARCPGVPQTDQFGVPLTEERRRLAEERRRPAAETRHPRPGQDPYFDPVEEPPSPEVGRRPEPAAPPPAPERPAAQRPRVDSPGSGALGGRASRRARESPPDGTIFRPGLAGLPPAPGRRAARARPRTAGRRTARSARAGAPPTRPPRPHRHRQAPPSGRAGGPARTRRRPGRRAPRAQAQGPGAAGLGPLMGRDHVRREEGRLTPADRAGAPRGPPVSGPRPLSGPGRGHGRSWPPRRRARAGTGAPSRA